MNCISSRNNYNYFTDSSAILFLFFFSKFSCVEAQRSPPQDENDQYARFNPSMAIIMVVLVGALFLLGFFSIYIRRCSEDGGASHHEGHSVHRAGRLGAAFRGLDGEVLETFPTFTYSTVKGLKIGKGALECAVCLNEFADEENIRLIPNCDHVFHVECIDAWLENHVTCPVCRSNLVDGSTHRASSSDLELRAHENNHNQTTMVEEGNTDHLRDNRTPILSRITSAKTFLIPGSKQHLLEKFRSHSTGHSLGVGENTDTDTERFTLRLPKGVRSKMISNASLKRSESRVSMVAEGSARKGYRTGEGSSTSSSGGIRSYRRMRSDGWVFTRASSFLSRPLSFKSQKTSADNIPLNNVGPKSDDFGSKGDDYGQPPV